jgi:hypothetical protein
VRATRRALSLKQRSKPLSAKVQSLLVRQGPGPRDPTRDELRRAIEHADATRRAVEASKNSVARAMRHQDECVDRLTLATEAVTVAKSARASRLAAAAASGAAVTSDRGMLEARAAEVAARDELEAAGLSLAELQAAVEDPERLDRAAQKRVADCARVVLRGSAEQGLQTVARLQAELTTALGAIWAIHREAFPWPPTPESERIRFQFQYPPAPVLDRSNPGAAKFDEYFLHLQRDADAAPPSI